MKKINPMKVHSAMSPQLKPKDGIKSRDKIASVTANKNDFIKSKLHCFNPRASIIELAVLAQ